MSDINELKEKFDRHELDVSSLTEEEANKLNLMYEEQISNLDSQIEDVNEQIETNKTDTVFPEGIESVPKRFAIVWRNQWMIDRSDFVITFVQRDFGGAATFQKKAEKKGKRIINLAERCK